jgi:hypothetical protein
LKKARKTLQERDEQPPACFLIRIPDGWTHALPFENREVIEYKLLARTLLELITKKADEKTDYIFNRSIRY